MGRTEAHITALLAAQDGARGNSTAGERGAIVVPDGSDVRIGDAICTVETCVDAVDG